MVSVGVVCLVFVVKEGFRSPPFPVQDDIPCCKTCACRSYGHSPFAGYQLLHYNSLTHPTTFPSPT